MAQIGKEVALSCIRILSLLLASIHALYQLFLVSHSSLELCCSSSHLLLYFE